jgi:hypothetical protein
VYPWCAGCVLKLATGNWQLATGSYGFKSITRGLTKTNTLNYAKFIDHFFKLCHTYWQGFGSYCYYCSRFSCFIVVSS